MNNRLTAAEADRIRATQGRICRGCRTIFTPDQIPDSFAVDERTKDGLSKLCLACIDRRDAVTVARLRDSRASAQAHYRETMREIRHAAVRAKVEEALAGDPPKHLVPECSLPGYPPSATTTGPNAAPAPRTDREAAILTQLYGRLIDNQVTHWEMLAGKPRSVVLERIFRLGPRTLDLIDEHLRAFGLDPLKP